VMCGKGVWCSEKFCWSVKIFGPLKWYTDRNFFGDWGGVAEINFFHKQIYRDWSDTIRKSRAHFFPPPPNFFLPVRPCQSLCNNIFYRIFEQTICRKNEFFSFTSFAQKFRNVWPFYFKFNWNPLKPNNIYYIPLLGFKYHWLFAGFLFLIFSHNIIFTLPWQPLLFLIIKYLMWK
jgi:hypothetical protein